MEEKSFVPFEGLLYGRMSFRGFNPEVEVCQPEAYVGCGPATPECHFALLQKLMALMNPHVGQPQADADAGRMQTDVTDEEMALRWVGGAHSGWA